MQSSANKHLNSVFDKMLESISFKDILSEKQIQHISGQLYSCILEVLVSKELYSLLKNIDKPVLELLSDNLKDTTQDFFKDKLQYAVKEIILWIEKNKSDIEGLIERAIDDTIEFINDGMKKSTLNLIRG